MTNNEYLRGLLEGQKLSEDENNLLIAHKEEVEGFLREKFGNEPTIKFSGSKAKHTMIKESYDLDIVCYFTSSNPKTLKELHDKVQSVLSDKYQILPKASAVRILDLTGDDNFDNQNYHIDVVPGRFIDETNHDAFLHVVYGEKERIQTNIKIHINYISNSGCRELIKLTKLWACRNNLSFKTFILELFVVHAMTDYKEKDNYELAFLKILQDIADNFESIRLVDPANSNNIVTESIDDYKKNLISGQARGDIEKINQNNDIKTWGDIFRDPNIDNILEEEEENNEEELSLFISPYEDLSHCLPPQWPAVSSGCSIGIRCFSTDNKNKYLEEIFSDGETQYEDYSLKYEATVRNQPINSEIFWQVVNTGKEARDNGALGLRGDFFKGRYSSGKPTEDERINYESTKYTGKHWIECFIVSNGQLVARSGKFYVNIINRSLHVKRQNPPMFRMRKPNGPKNIRKLSSNFIGL